MLTKWAYRHPDGVGDIYGVRCFSVTCKPGLHRRDCHLWMVGDDYRCAGALDGIRQNVVPRSSLVVLTLTPAAALARFSVINSMSSYWLACWIGNIAMVVIGVGYLSYFFPILKDPLVLTITCVVVLWIFVLLNIVGPKMITRVQAVATVLALIPIVGIAVFGWFWFRGETYMAAWNVSGLGTFGAIQSTLNVTLWSFIGVESASVAAGVAKNPKRNVPIATIGGVLIAAVCYVLSTTAIMGMIQRRTARFCLAIR